MTAQQAIKEALITEIDQLPEEELYEVFDFVQFLLYKKRRQTVPKRPEIADIEQDPIVQQFLGGVSHGSLGQNIDQELYGS